MEDLVRKLITGQFISDLNYKERKFSFKTVFYQSAYSYCMCVCGFENEYFDYISKTGEINETILDRILKNIVTGKCPHVEKVNAKYVRESSIHAIHIATVTGTVRAVKNYLHNYEDVYGGIFKLNPYRIAILKEKVNIVSLFQNSLQNIFNDVSTITARSLMYGYRSKENPNKIKIELLSVPLFCVKKRNRDLLKLILNPFVQYVSVNKALELTFKNSLTDMSGDIIHYVQNRQRHDSTSTADVRDCAVSAIVYDEPRALRSILELYNSKFIIKSDLLLSEICSVLNRSTCADTLQNLGLANSDGRVFHTLSRLFFLLSRFNDEFKDEIIAHLKEIAHMRDILSVKYRKGMTRLHQCVGPYKQIDPCEVRALLSLGADIDILDDNGNTVMLYLLSPRHYITGLQEAVEMLLYENPSRSLNKAAVERALELDEHLESARFVKNASGEYIVDCVEHSLFGCSDYAFNFLGPLLIECGFPVTLDTLVNSLDRVLHPAEYAYLRNCLSKPRSLRHSCRDVIREHFKQRQLYRFLDTSDIPRQIKDFVLLKDVIQR